MNLVTRAINIITQPKPEWQRIDGEPATVPGLFTSYAAILALLPLLGTLIGGVLLSPYIGFSFFLVNAIIGYVLSLGVLFLMIFVADALAPNFGGGRNQVAAAKVLIYSATPIWLAGTLSFIPGLNIIVMLVGFGYAAYLMYLGSQTVLKIPADKAIAFTAAVIIIWFVIAYIAAALISGIVVAAMMGSAAMGGGYIR